MRNANRLRCALICLSGLIAGQIWSPALAAGSWYFVDTRMVADGTVTRELFQPLGSVPLVAQQPSAWKSFQLVSPPNQLLGSSSLDLNVPIPAIARSFGPPVDDRPTYVVADYLGVGPP